MRPDGYLIAAVFALSVWVTEQAQAGIYMFSDTGGVVHVTNSPSDPRYSAMTRVRYKTSADNVTRIIVLQNNPRLPEVYKPLLEKAAREHSIDQALLQAVMAAESGYEPHVISRKGAVGLMQLMPETARRYGVHNLYDPAENIQGGAKYLRDLMRKFNNDLSLTLAAYNAGEDAIIQYGHRIPPYRETLQYVPRVLTLYREYQRHPR